MIKKLLIILCIALFFVAGCDKKDDIVRIKYSTWGSKSEITLVKSLINDFEAQNPKIKIELIHIPDNYFQKLHLLIASNLAPDVIFINNLNSQIYIETGKLTSLSEYLKSSANLKNEDFLEKSLLPLSTNGEIFAIPRDISNLVIYYNKDLFDKYSVPYPSKNWTMADFLKTVQALSDEDVFGMGFEENSLFWLPFLLSNGGGILSEDGKKLIIGEKSSMDALQFYADLRNKYNVAPKNHQQASLTTSQLFLQGKVAMHLCGRWCSLTYKKNADFNWDVAKFPAGKMGSIVGLDASGWAISSSSKHKDEAWKFIEFMASDKAIETMAMDGLILPAKKNVANSEIFLAPPPESAKVFIEAISEAKPTPINSKYSELQDILEENLESLFNGKSSAEEIINDKLLKKLENLLQ